MDPCGGGDFGLETAQYCKILQSGRMEAERAHASIPNGWRIDTSYKNRQMRRLRGTIGQGKSHFGNVRFVHESHCDNVRQTSKSRCQKVRIFAIMSAKGD